MRPHIVDSGLPYPHHAGEPPDQPQGEAQQPPVPLHNQHYLNNLLDGGLFAGEPQFRSLKERFNICQDLKTYSSKFSNDKSLTYYPLQLSTKSDSLHNMTNVFLLILT
jgi:hypothetical protein